VIHRAGAAALHSPYFKSGLADTVKSPFAGVGLFAQD
jgi:hypothetical protein